MRSEACATLMQGAIADNDVVSAGPMGFIAPSLATTPFGRFLPK